jgi:hypothetical protein
MMGGATVPETREKKTIAAEVFEDAAFKFKVVQCSPL